MPPAAWSRRVLTERELAGNDVFVARLPAECGSSMFRYISPYWLGEWTPRMALEAGARVVHQCQLDRPASLTECLLYRHDSVVKWRLLRSWPCCTVD
jgi:hypothetical protein